MGLKKIIKEWWSFWDSLNYGPKGAFVGFVIAFAYYVVPWLLKLILAIMVIAAVTLAGALVGEIVGWFIKLVKKKK